jgi:hypothetical protein
VSQGFWLACRACGARSVVDVAGSRPGKRWRRGWLQVPARHEVQGEIEARLASSKTRGRAGRTAESTATSTLAVGDLPEALELSNGGFSSAEHRRVLEEVRGVERGKWATVKRTKGSRGFLFGYHELGPRWSRVDAIGLGGRRSGAALYAESSGEVVAVGGGMVWTGRPQVQTRHD